MFKCECGNMEFKAVMTVNIKVTTESGYPEHIAGTEDTKYANIDGLFECVKCKKIYSDIWDNENSGNNDGRRCVCGNTRFIAHQVCYHDVIVDNDNNFARNIDIGEAENPYGPYICTVCDAEYENLDELDKKTEKTRIFTLPADSELKIKKDFPNGMALIVETNNDPNYPGVQTSIIGNNPDDMNETVCFVEFNSAKPKGHELCVGVYTSNQDEPAYYSSYNETGDNQ